MNIRFNNKYKKQIFNGKNLINSKVVFIIYLLSLNYIYIKFSNYFLLERLNTFYLFPHNFNSTVLKKRW